MSAIWIGFAHWYENGGARIQVLALVYGSISGRT